MHRQLLFLSCALALVLGTGARAAAQSDDVDRYRTRIYGGLGLGFGGETEWDVEGPLGNNVDLSGDLITTVGGQFGVEYVVLRYLALGAEFRVRAINTEDGEDAEVDRAKLFDIDLKPRLRYPFGRILEVYLTVPIGLTIPKLPDNAGDNGALDEHVGWNLGVGGGVSVFPLPHFGINLEPLWLMHKFRVDGPVGVDADVTVRQFALMLNLVLAL